MTDLEREAREAARLAFGDCAGRYVLNEEKWREGYLAAAAPRDQEIERLRAELAKVTEQRDAWPKYHGTAVEGLMILHDRKDLQDLAGLRCGDFMANAVPHIVAEIDRLRARVAGLEGMVPKWVEWDSDERRNLTKAGAVGIGDDELIEGKWHRLMVPPIPLPETKA